jgi:hypothetical protein
MQATMQENPIERLQRLRAERQNDIERRAWELRLWYHRMGLTVPRNDVYRRLAPDVFLTSIPANENNDDDEQTRFDNPTEHPSQHVTLGI